MKKQLIILSLALAALLNGVVLSVQAAETKDNHLTSSEKRDGWLLLFDGKTLDGWMTSAIKPPLKGPEDGAINPHKTGHYMLVHTQKWSDYILQMDFKISPKCNTGVFVRTSTLEPRPNKDVGYNGIEIAIDDTHEAGFVDTGAFYDLSKPTRNAMKPVGEWNHLEVTSKGPTLEVVLNGEKVNHIDLDQFTEKNKRPDGTPHKFDVVYKEHPRAGYIGLQDHGADCWYKNIKIKPLKP